MLEVKNIYCGYDNVDVVKDISFKVERGQNLCIIGPNGCGKSTLLKAIAKLIDYRGEITLDNLNVESITRKELASKVALMNQVSNIYFSYTVFYTVALGRYAYLNGVFAKLSKDDHKIINDALEKVGLLELKDRLITELSGGQLQRVYLARCFTQDPEVILLDEPTNHLDLKHQIELLEYLKVWSKDNKKVVVAVLHDLNLVHSFSDEVIMMKDGKLVQRGNVREVLNGDKLKEVYDIDVKEYMIDSLKKWRE